MKLPCSFHCNSRGSFHELYVRSTRYDIQPANLGGGLNMCTCVLSPQQYRKPLFLRTQRQDHGFKHRYSVPGTRDARIMMKSGNAKCTTGGVCYTYTTAARSSHGSRTGKQLTGARGHGLGLSWKLSWSPKRASTPGDTCAPSLCPRCASTLSVVYLSLYTPPLLICRMHLVRAIMSSLVLAWYRAFMEAIVEPKQASTPVDTRLPRAQAVICQFFSGGVFKP